MILFPDDNLLAFGLLAPDLARYDPTEVFLSRFTNQRIHGSFVATIDFASNQLQAMITGRTQLILLRENVTGIRANEQLSYSRFSLLGHRFSKFEIQERREYNAARGK